MSALFKKMKIKPGMSGLVVNAPEGLDLKADADVKLGGPGPLDFALIFVHNSADLGKHLPGVLGQFRDEGLLWVAYPKISSGVKTDITRDKGWGAAAAKGYVGVALVSLDATWSVMRLRHQSKTTRRG